jgi:hypothetical protein
LFFFQSTPGLIRSLKHMMEIKPEDNRPVLTHFYFTPIFPEYVKFPYLPHQIRIAATDGYLLETVKFGATVEEGFSSLLVPIAKRLIEFLEEHEGKEISVQSDGWWSEFKSLPSGDRIMFDIYDGQYPDINPLIEGFEKKSEYKYTLRKDMFGDIEEQQKMFQELVGDNYPYGCLRIWGSTLQAGVEVKDEGSIVADICGFGYMKDTPHEYAHWNFNLHYVYHMLSLNDGFCSIEFPYRRDEPLIFHAAFGDVSHSQYLMAVNVDKVKRGYLKRIFGEID